MGIIVGLLSTGIGLAIEAASEYQANKSTGKRTNSNYQQDLTYGSRGGYSEDDQAERDAKAFQELQSYADFQSVLSNRVQDDILRDQKHIPTNPQILSKGPPFDDYFSHEPYMHPSTQRLHPPKRLPCPVVIPQRRPEDNGTGWVEAYAPALMDCGVDHYTFLNFLDGFNKAKETSPNLDVINVADLGVGFAPSSTPMLLSTVIPLAVKIAKNTTPDNKTDDFMTRANNELFVPHGLFAMVLTYNPTNSSQTNTANSLLPSPYGFTSPARASHSSLASATMKSLQSDYSAVPGQQNKLRQIGNFIADYGDRRAESRRASANHDPALFRSRWGVPSNPANNGGLSSLVIGRLGRDDKKKERKHRRRKSSSRQVPRDQEGGQISSFRQTFNGMVSGGEGDGQENMDEEFVNRPGMRENVLYLVIANNPMIDVEPSYFNASTSATSQISYPFRDEKRIKNSQVLEPDPFQHQEGWAADDRVGWLAKDHKYRNSPMGTRERSPPPAYRSSGLGGPDTDRYEKRARRTADEYCVPTL